MVSLDDVRAAAARIREQVYLSPCARSETLSRLSGTNAFLKLENLQMTGAYKERGALNKLLLMAPAERARGLIAASAGNHAQAVAFHGGRLGVSVTIVMPETTPITKVDNTRSHGARVVLHGASYDEAYEEARRIEAAEGLTFIHPFDDPQVIAGQGTMGLEILEQVPDVEAVLVPIGGGGLAAGLGVALKEQRPGVRLIGVEAGAIACMKAARLAGHPVTLQPASTLADGIAVKRAGDLTFEHLQRYLDDVVTVSEEEIAAAILYCLEKEKTVAEGAGAVGVAALLHRRAERLEGRRVVSVVSGGNIDVNIIARIIERGLVQLGRLVRISIALLDKPGQLTATSGIIAACRANVIEVHHTRAFVSKIGDTTLQLTLETRGPEHVEEILAALRAAGYTVERLGG